MGMDRRRGKRETRAEKAGLARNMKAMVPVMSQGSLSAPRAMPKASRMGRRR